MDCCLGLAFRFLREEAEGDALAFGPATPAERAAAVSMGIRSTGSCGGAGGALHQVKCKASKEKHNSTKEKERRGEGTSVVRFLLSLSIGTAQGAVQAAR